MLLAKRLGYQRLGTPWRSGVGIGIFTSWHDITATWWRESTNSWWRHQMGTFSALLALCSGNSLVTGEFPAQRPVTCSFDVFFDLRLTRLSKQSWGWWIWDAIGLRWIGEKLCKPFISKVILHNHMHLQQIKYKWSALSINKDPFTYERHFSLSKIRYRN